VLGYPAGSNRVVDITRGATTVRSFTYDGAGNMLSDSRLGTRRMLVGIRRRHQKLYAYT
jgi:YD repeat-containing protein